MSPAGLGPICGQRPGLRLEVDVGPAHFCNLDPALPGDEAHLKEGTERVNSGRPDQ
jgi:hypothetical protein